MHVQVGDRPGDQCEHPDAADRGALDPAIRPPPHRCAPSTSSPIIAGMYVSVVSPRRHHPPIWVWCRACQPDPVGTAAVSALCSTSCVIRTAQVTGPFDPLPSSVPSREVHGRPAAGTSQVSQRPAELAQHRPAGLSVAGRCILPPIRRPGSRGLLPGGSVQSDPISAGLPRLPLDPRATRGPDPRPTSGLPGAWRALHRGRRPIEIEEPAVR